MIIYGGDDGEGRSLHDVWSYHIIKGVWAKLHVVVSTVGARGRENEKMKKKKRRNKIGGTKRR
jgi:hypothetical protein